jgi:hypothetical protein
MKKQKMGFVFSLLIMILFLSCENVSQQTINEAKAAIENAKACGASVFCQDQFHSAQTAYDSALSEIAVQSKKKQLERKFSKAIEFLQKSINTANNAFNETLMKKEKLRVEIQRSLSKANNFLDSTELLMNQGKRSKRTTSIILVNLDSLKVLIEQVKTQLADDELLKAQGNVETVVIQTKILYLKTISLLHAQKNKSK